MNKVVFDDSIALNYDVDVRSMYHPDVLDPAVDFLEAFAGEGAALEFGIGTGRIAVPLSARGVLVHGIDISEPMLQQLQSKSGSERIGVSMGDFSKTRVCGSFGLVYLVFNTIMNLTTQAEQVACFQNAAAHLTPGGVFVIEVQVPDLRRLPPGERVRAFHISQSRFGFDEYTDFSGQIVHSHHYWTDSGKLRTFSAPFRFVWPSELDLMARLANMTLVERWAGWKREPFTDESESHVSVWQKLGS
jgi:SAM-dependent methyltransferase